MTETRHRARRRRRRGRKDRLIQARVGEDLERALKQEAARRRLSLSQLVRNTLEDAFHLVEDVAADVEQLVAGSVELASAVGRDARRLASIARGESSTRSRPAVGPALGESSQEAPGSGERLERIYGWNRAIPNRAVACGRCGASIERGGDALVGLTDEPGPPLWLCESCASALS